MAAAKGNANQEIMGERNMVRDKQENGSGNTMAINVGQGGWNIITESKNTPQQLPGEQQLMQQVQHLHQQSPEGDNVLLNRYQIKKSGIGIARKEIPKKRSPVAERNLEVSRVTQHVEDMSSNTMGRSRQYVSESQLLFAQQHQQKEDYLSSLRFNTHTPQRYNSVGGYYMTPMRHGATDVFSAAEHPLSKQLRQLSQDPMTTMYDAMASYTEGLQSMARRVNNEIKNCDKDGLCVGMATNALDRNGDCNQVGAKKMKGSTLALNAAPDVNRSSTINGTGVNTHSTSTDTVTALSTGMPMTTMTYTTSITTTMRHSGMVSTVATASTPVNISETVIMSSMVVDDERVFGKDSDVEEVPEGKRKKTDEQEEMEVNVAKKRNVEMGDDSIMCNLLNEMKGIKSSITDVNTNVVNLDGKVNMLQDESKQWWSKMLQVEKDVSDMKDSLEMAHNLINAEKSAREGLTKEVRQLLDEKSRELSNSVSVIKGHGTEIKGIQSDVKTFQTRIKKIEDEHNELKEPMRQMKNHLCNVNSEREQEFSVSKTLVAQNVWFQEDEDIDKVASTIIHKALNLPDIKVVRSVHKSGQKSGKGLIKIKLDSNDSIKKVLDQKRMLQESEVSEILDIF